MSDDNETALPIPAFIKSMLDPYVNVMGERNGEPPKNRLELTFLDEMLRPTNEQLQAIGLVTTAWSVMERIIGITIARLALAPEYPTLALTKVLSAQSQLQVLKALISLHGERYRQQIANKALIDELTTLPARITILKDERNLICHTVWHRQNSETLTALRTGAVTESKSIASPIIQRTVTEINKLANEIQTLADHLFMLTQLLPAVDEGQHAQSLSRVVRTLHDEILPTRPHPPESSGE
jgi:hypothetical protein